MFINFVEAVDQEIDLLRRLRYRLIVLQSLTKDDSHEAMQPAIVETQESYENLRGAELIRAAATIKLTDQLELDPGAGMNEIAAISPGAWEEIVLERRKYLIESIDGVQRIIDDLKGVLSRRMTQTERALEFLKEHSSSGYGTGGSKTGMLITGAI